VVKCIASEGWNLTRTMTIPDKDEVRRTNKSNVGIAADACCMQLDVLEQDTSRILHLIQSWRNGLTPVNRIPPEILALIPDFWDRHYGGRDRDVIALTHVCQAWREVFTSQSSLWTTLDWMDEDKTRVYLERSQSLPVNLSLHTKTLRPSHHPFFEIIPYATGRLKSLSVAGPPEHLQGIIAHLSRPAPLLEELSICGDHGYVPVLILALFNEDLSSLHSLCLKRVRTGLPWGNMVNLTSFTLCHAEVTATQLLDFFESAPHLRNVHLYSPTPTLGIQDDRSVLLACLKRMRITGGLASPLLDHLLIPVGTDLTIRVDLPTKDNPPRFLDNLRNLPNFTTVELSGADHWEPYI
jgi:hypothetical protein